MLSMIFTNINSIKGPAGGNLLPAGEKKAATFPAQARVFKRDKIIIIIIKIIIT